MNSLEGYVPLWKKIALTVDEAVKYSGIGEKTLRNALRQPGCTFALYVGNRVLVKRREFEKYISMNSKF